MSLFEFFFTFNNGNQKYCEDSTSQRTQIREWKIESINHASRAFTSLHDDVTEKVLENLRFGIKKVAEDLSIPYKAFG